MFPLFTHNAWSLLKKNSSALITLEVFMLKTNEKRIKKFSFEVIRLSKCCLPFYR